MILNGLIPLRSGAIWIRGPAKAPLIVLYSKDLLAEGMQQCEATGEHRMTMEIAGGK
jgi:hypothetical protein